EQLIDDSLQPVELLDATRRERPCRQATQPGVLGRIHVHEERWVFDERTQEQARHVSIEPERSAETTIAEDGARVVVARREEARVAIRKLDPDQSLLLDLLVALVHGEPGVLEHRILDNLAAHGRRDSLTMAERQIGEQAGTGNAALLITTSRRP